jgi:hypothetical protein
MRVIKTFVFALLGGALCGTVAFAPPGEGILVMAHGGTPLWNTTVKTCVKNAQLAYPTRIFFGMGCSKKETADLQSQIHQLENQGAQSIVVVPLAISSYSEVYRQWRYLLGLESQPGFDPKLIGQMMEHMHGNMPANMPMMDMEPVSPVKRHAGVTFLPALDDGAVVSAILLERAQELSHKPEEESVVIISHGPNQDEDNRIWVRNLQHLASVVEQQGHFHHVEGATLRDDAPPPIRSQAVQHLRDRVTTLGKEGRVLIIPLLLAPGGIEEKIALALQGLTYSMNSKTLLPDPKMADWIRQCSTQTSLISSR